MRPSTVLLASSLCYWGVSAADTLPSTKIGAAALIRPQSAESYYSTDTTSTNSIGTTGYPVEVVELAKALGNDVDAIYDFVRNYVDTVFIFGVQKGAMGAIIDKSGTPFDQAQLMVSMLRQAGYTASYQFGTITLSGAQFQAWTGITNAQAACNLLASGGIPANINGSSASFGCSTLSNTATVSTAELDHVWVSVTIGSSSYVFDPSYKAYCIRPGLNLSTAAALTTGQALNAAKTGSIISATGAVGYVKNLNAGSLNAQLTTYANNIQNTIQGQSAPAVSAPCASMGSAPLVSGQIKDLVGGRDILFTPVGHQRITTLPYTSAVTRTWTGGIPDAFRTTLQVTLWYQGAPLRDPQHSTIKDPIVNKVLYVDDIYGRKLIYDTYFGTLPFQGSLKLVDEFGTENTLTNYTGPVNPQFSNGKLTLTVNHPYAADATGTGMGGTYMDVSITKGVRYALPFTIVHGWGDANRGLIDKWSSRPDTVLPTLPPPDCTEECGTVLHAYKGDGRREAMTAGWLVQSSKAARLHAQIANSIYTHHHTIGVASADTTVEKTTYNATSTNPIDRYTVLESLDRIDVDTGMSVTSIDANAVARRAAIHAIAATEAALEGSVIAQYAALPDIVTVATRFQWANSPPSGEDPSGAGPRLFYEFNSVNGSDPTNQVKPLMVAEGGVAPPSFPALPSGEQALAPLEYDDRRNASATAVALYTTQGFTVVSSGEGFNGPGERIGGTDGVGQSYVRTQSMQRGGALVATLYDSNGVDPLQIAHVAVNPNGLLNDGSSGVPYVAVFSGYQFIKGGGGGTQPYHDTLFDPSTPADILKSRFVDRSQGEGVDLQTGQVTYASPASLTVGNGSFPYSLTAGFLWRGGNVQNGQYGTRSEVEPHAPFTTNWNNSLTLSGSGLEAMGETDVRAAAGTVAAFLAMQDMYKAAVSKEREVAAVLASAWWMNQLARNVATVNVGNDTRQFVRRYDGTWIPTGPGPYASLSQTGQWTPTEIGACSGAPKSHTRAWNDDGISFAVTNANGDTQKFLHWSNTYGDGGIRCAYLEGFRLDSWTFPQGVSIKLTYEPDFGGIERLKSVSNSLNREIDFVFDSSGRHVSGYNNALSGTDARAVAISEYPAAGTSAGTLTITDPAGAATTIVHSVDGGRHRLDKVLAANNSTTPALEYTYDSLRRVSQVKDAVALQAGNRAPYYFHFAEKARADRVDPAGGIYSVIFDTYQRAIGYIDEIGRTSAAEYDGRGRVTKRIYAEGDGELFAFDDHNNVTLLRKLPKPNGAGDVAFDFASAQWDQTWNKPAWIRDALGNRTDFTYYPAGQVGASLLQQATLPSPDAGLPAPIYQYTYDSLGRLATSIDPTNVLIKNIYDPITKNLLTSTLDPTGTIPSVTSYTYDANGDVSTVTDGRGKVAEKKYDANRRNTVVLHHDGGLSAALIAAEQNQYDVLGRIFEKDAGVAFNGASSVATWQKVYSATFTPTSKIETESNGAGDTTYYKYDAADRGWLVTDPVGRRVATVYNLAGESLCVWRGWNSTASPLSCSWNPSAYTGTGPVRYAAYSYTFDGNVGATLDADNNLTTNTYDNYDRLYQVIYPVAASGANASNSNDFEAYKYYPTGTVWTKRLRDGQAITYGYDHLNRLNSKDLPDTTTNDVTYGYDGAGRRAFAHFTNGMGVDYVYDTAGRLKTETTFGRTLIFTPDAAGNRVRLTWPDTNYVTYDYDSLNRVSYIRELGASSGPGVLAQYGYDYLSRVGTVTWGNGTSTGHGYDLASRLTSLTQDLAGSAQDLSLGFIFTPASQLRTRNNSNSIYDPAVPTVSKAYVPNGLNQYGSVGGTNYSYDLRGNLTSDGVRIFTYDSENHLLTETGGAGLTLSYDPLGRLYQAISGGATTQFLYDGDRLVAEYSGSGTLLRRYVHGTGNDTPVVWYEGSGLTARTWLHPDERGSIVVTSDGSGNGTVYTYDAYGVPNLWSGSRFRYTGQIMLPEVQLYHYKARIYDPSIGRFLQTDPIGGMDDLNLYTYVGNDPLDGTDPTGKDCIDRRTGPCETVTVTPPPPQPPLSNTIAVPIRAPASLSWVRAAGGTLATGAAAILADMLTTDCRGDSGPLPNCGKGSNVMGSKASGEPPVPGATPGRETKGRAEQWEKAGGQAEADKDFDNLQPTGVRPIPGGRAGTLPDGRSINVRGDSSDGRPTLEIQDGKKSIKVRYN